MAERHVYIVCTFGWAQKMNKCEKPDLVMLVIVKYHEPEILHMSCRVYCPWRFGICMQVARGGHQKGKVAKHQCCWGGTWYVQLQEEEMAKTLGMWTQLW